jgi:hypothetical protein
MPNLASGVWQDAEGAVVVVVENNIAPTDAEWDAYCRHIAATLKVENASGIAITDGGGPNTVQRGKVNDLLAGRQARSAVVSDSRMIRGVVTALSWFNRLTRAFSPAAIDRGLEFAGVRGERAKAVWKLVVQLDEQISPRSQTVKVAGQHLRF